jgi:hypothetical protein
MGTPGGKGRVKEYSFQKLRKKEVAAPVVY